ncbi:MAG: AI-2E family transporter [Roseiflexaceae bacterium]
MKRLVQITLTIGATLLALLVVWVFQPTLALFGGSLAISAALRPLVQHLETRGIKRGWAILLWYVLALVALVVGTLIYGVGVADELRTAAEQLPQAYTSAVDAWVHGSDLQQSIARGLPNFDTLVQNIAAGGGLALIGGTVLGVAGGAVNILIFSFAALSLAYYWLIEAAHFERLWLSLLPVGTRIRARDIWRNAEAAMGAYIRATVLAVAVSALLLLALYRVAGIPLANTLALLGGFSQIVPRLGPAFVLLPAILVALMISPLHALVVLIVGGAIQIATHTFAVRTMQQDALKVNPLLQVLLLLALAYVGGLWAMIFAPPLAALIQVLYASVLVSSTVTQQRESELELLAERLARLQASPDAERVEISSTLRRSDDLLNKARLLLDGK